MTRKIALIGERDLTKAAHAGIEASLAIFQREGDAGLTYSWINTAAITADTVDGLLKEVTGIWCAPGSPYASTEGALRAIRHTRLEKKTFLGTCGGFQHALMEFAQNVLGHAAEHEETTPGARTPLIAKLSCSLIGASGRIIAAKEGGFAGILGGAESTEEYHCNYGMNPGLERIFEGSELVFVAHDEAGQVRAFRLKNHRFFVGTLFQPERRALGGSLHPLVRAFFGAA